MIKHEIVGKQICPSGKLTVRFCFAVPFLVFWPAAARPGDTESARSCSGGIGH